MFNVAHRVIEGWSNKIINIEVELGVSFRGMKGFEMGGVISIKVYKEAKPGASFWELGWKIGGVVIFLIK